MRFTETAPAVPLQMFKRTKIVATIGPSTNDPDVLYRLIESGANCLRFNFSHGTHEERLQQTSWIRSASEKLGKPVAIMQDVQGPKVRLGDFEGTIAIKAGQQLTFAHKGDYAATGHIPMQYDLSKKVQPGERLYLFDGKVRTTITGIEDGLVHAVAANDGEIVKRKGMNLPDTDFKGDILTEKDLEDIRFGATQDFDYVAVSFVQTAADIEHVRSILQSLGSTAKIIAKIETKLAIDNIEAIVQAVDVVMVARGDLGVETPLETVPVVQRRVTALCRKYAKPVIVATQMLVSMVDHPEPTRAEVSDVATAVFTGADAVMLSEETANGKYPLEAVQVMKRVVTYTEQHAAAEVPHTSGYEQGVPHAVANAVIAMADKIDARAILVETTSGATVQRITALRPHVPVIAVTNEVRTAQQLALVYGVKSYFRPAKSGILAEVAAWLQQHLVFKPGDAVVMVSGQSSGVSGTTDTIKVRVLQ